MVRRIVISVAIMSLVVTMICVGCAKPEPTAEPTEDPSLQAEYQELIDQGIVRADLLLNPYGSDFALKPDGTPYRFSALYMITSVDVAWNHCGVMESYIERAGAECTILDCNYDVEVQIGQIEDIIALDLADGIFLHATNEDMLVPAAEKAEAAGIPLIAFDTYLHSENVTSRVHHDYKGETASNLMAEYFLEKVRQEGKHLNIVLVWGPKSVEIIQDRANRFKETIEANPELATIVVETPETFCGNEDTCEYLLDAFTAYPELNTVYVTCGGETGTIEALRALDRLYPRDHPDHVLCALNDCDTIALEQMDAGYVDCFLANFAPHLADVPLKLMFHKVVLRQSVPQDVVLPMNMVTPKTSRDLVYGVSVAYPRLPYEKWDLWPVLDTTEIGIETPTKEMRKELCGY